MCDRFLDCHTRSMYMPPPLREDAAWEQPRYSTTLGVRFANIPDVGSQPLGSRHKQAGNRTLLRGDRSWGSGFTTPWRPLLNRESPAWVLRRSSAIAGGQASSAILSPSPPAAAKMLSWSLRPLCQTPAQHMRSYLDSVVRKKPHPRKPAR